MPLHGIIKVVKKGGNKMLLLWIIIFMIVPFVLGFINGYNSED